MQILLHVHYHYYPLFDGFSTRVGFVLHICGPRKGHQINDLPDKEPHQNGEKPGLVETTCTRSFFYFTSTFMPFSLLSLYLHWTFATRKLSQFPYPYNLELVLFTMSLVNAAAFSVPPSSQSTASFPPSVPFSRFPLTSSSCLLPSKSMRYSSFATSGKRVLFGSHFAVNKKISEAIDAAAEDTEHHEMEDITSTGTLLYSFTPLPLLFVAALPGGMLLLIPHIIKIRPLPLLLFRDQLHLHPIQEWMAAGMSKMFERESIQCLYSSL